MFMAIQSVDLHICVFLIAKSQGELICFTSEVDDLQKSVFERNQL